MTGQRGEWTRVATEFPSLTLDIRTSFDDPALREALGRHMGQDSLEELERVHEGRRAAVYRLRVGDRSYFVKRYEFPRAFMIRTFAYSSRAQREARALLMFEKALDGDVQVAAWGEIRRAGFCPRCYVVTTELVGCHDLKHVKRLPPEERRERLDVVQEQLPAIVAQIHDAGLFVRDLKGKNLLLQPETGRISIIDVPRASYVGALSAKQRQYDLGTLYRELRQTFSSDEWRAFVQRYLELAKGVSTDQTEATLRGASAVAESLDHDSGLGGAFYHLRKRLKRTRLGELLSGHSYESKER